LFSSPWIATVTLRAHPGFNGRQSLDMLAILKMVAPPELASGSFRGEF